MYNIISGWVEGPPLNIARRVHACGVLTLQDGRKFAVVSGGASDQNPSVQQSVEMLNLGNIDEGFISRDLMFFSEIILGLFKRLSWWKIDKVGIE